MCGVLLLSADVRVYIHSQPIYLHSVAVMFYEADGSAPGTVYLYIGTTYLGQTSFRVCSHRIARGKFN